MTIKTNPLRVLMVAPNYFPSTGGVETHVHEVGCRLVQSGVNVTLLSTVPYAHPAPLPKEDVIEGMRVIRVRAWPPGRDCCLAPEIYSIIERGSWDIIHCQGCHTFVPPVAMLASKKARIPYILTFHSGGHSSHFRTAIRGIQWQLMRPLLARASKLIGVSRFEVDYFQRILRLPMHQFTVIPNGATLPVPAYSESGAPDQTLIVSIGRLERYKGHQHAIAALPAIREQRPEARLLILGTGPYEAALRELARRVGVAEQVEICSVPASDRQGVADVLSQAALVVLLSEYEAHPIAIMEALALRRPVLIADTSGLREIAQQGLARAVSLQGTPEEIARVALQQIEEPLVPPTDLALPDWDDCARQLQDVYSSVSAWREQCVS